jgi:fatty-acyl-CoA synthase
MLRPEGSSFDAVVAQNARAAPSHPAILYQDQTISYGELVERAGATAKALMAQGLTSADRIGILMGNVPDFVVLTVATSMLGISLVPLNTWYKRNELAWTIRHADLAALIVARKFLKTDYGQVLSDLIPTLSARSPRVNVILEKFPRLRLVVFTGECPSGALSWPDFLREGEGIAEPVLQAAREAASHRPASFVLYTSGSTGEPKGVILGHEKVIANGFDLGQRRGITSEDRVWLGAPLFYALGAANALPAAITAGATIVLQDHFEAGSAIDLIERTEASVYYGTGNISGAILDHPDYAQRRIGSLKKGNAGLGAEYKRLTLVKMGITGAVPAYGLTETCGNAAVGLPDDPLEIKLASDGLPLPGMEMLIVDPVSRKSLRQGEPGLVLVRGHTTRGYLKNPAETNKAIDANGFFDTGDLGQFDPEGRFVFRSRLKEVIKSGGINISPIEVEQLLVTHPDVRDAYVVGVRDAARGEVIVAFVEVLRPVSERNLCDHVRDQAATFKAPHHVFFRKQDQLPRLASGKVSKYRLQLEAARELGL